MLEKSLSCSELVMPEDDEKRRTDKIHINFRDKGRRYGSDIHINGCRKEMKANFWCKTEITEARRSQWWQANFQNISVAGRK